MKIGDTCMCNHGVIGVITRISKKDGRAIYYGYRKDNPEKKWQSICPRAVK